MSLFRICLHAVYSILLRTFLKAYKCTTFTWYAPWWIESFHGKNHRRLLLIYLFIYYMVYTQVKSFTIVKNRKCGQVTSHCRKAQPYRADLSLFLNVPVVTVKSEITVWGRLFQTVGEAWQKARLEKFRTVNSCLCCALLWLNYCKVY